VANPRSETSSFLASWMFYRVSEEEYGRQKLKMMKMKKAKVIRDE
jgi:hypothetical protein